MVSKLEIAALGAYFRANQDLRAMLGIGKVGSGAIPSNEIEMLMKTTAPEPKVSAQMLFDLNGMFGQSANDQEFIGSSRNLGP
jgi:hypothetical protein